MGEDVHACRVGSIGGNACFELSMLPQPVVLITMVPGTLLWALDVPWSPIMAFPGKRCDRMQHAAVIVVLQASIGDLSSCEKAPS